MSGKGQTRNLNRTAAWTVDSVLSDDTSWVAEPVRWDEPDGSSSEFVEEDGEEEGAMDDLFTLYSTEQDLSVHLPKQ